jgi:tetratricopeptide (TPR) repeat protein
MIHVIYFNLGNAYFKHGQLKQAKFYLEHALKIRIKSIEKNPTLVGRTYNSLGNVEVSQGNDKKAKELYQKAHSIFLDVLGLEHEHTKLLSKKI